MKTLLTKFKVGSVIDFGNNNKEANLSAVTNAYEINKSFTIYTPNATLKIHITNPEALDFFKTGKEYFCEFKESDEKGKLSHPIESKIIG